MVAAGGHRRLLRSAGHLRVGRHRGGSLAGPPRSPRGDERGRGARTRRHCGRGVVPESAVVRGGLDRGGGGDGRTVLSPRRPRVDPLVRPPPRRGPDRCPFWPPPFPPPFSPRYPRAN